MGYRIDFSVGDGVLRATVSGGAALAARIARDISEQARQISAKRVLVDVRSLRDRFGRLRALLAAPDAPERLAVVDTWRHDDYYVFVERAARGAGRDLRRFDDHAAALAWLRTSRSPSWDR